METSIAVDGYHISVSELNGGVTLYVRDNGTGTSIEVGISAAQSMILSFAFKAAAEEGAQ